MIEQTVTIINRLGLHARAAAKFVKVSGRFSAHIDILRNGQVINGKSIMGVMMLAANQGSEITIRADGSDEQAAMEAIVALIADRFGEAE